MQKKKQETTELTEGPTTSWRGRLEVALLDQLKPHAKKGRRSIAAQINLVIEEWLQTHRLPSSPQTATPIPAMTPRQAQAVPPVIPPAPKTAPTTLQELVEDDEGWEGTTKSGAQVKI